MTKASLDLERLLRDRLASKGAPGTKVEVEFSPAGAMIHLMRDDQRVPFIPLDQPYRTVRNQSAPPLVIRPLLTSKPGHASDLFHMLDRALAELDWRVSVSGDWR